MLLERKEECRVGNVVVGCGRGKTRAVDSLQQNSPGIF